MSNGTVCCIHGVCCPPGQEARQKAALAKEMSAASSGWKTGGLDDVAGWVLDNFDLAPKGSLSPLVEALRPEFEKLFKHKAGEPT